MSQSVKAAPEQQPCSPPCKQLKRDFKWKEFEDAISPFMNAKEADPINHWDDYFSAIAMAASLRSKDPRKRVGAVIVSADHVVLSTGYNWLPRGVKERPERYTEKEEKLKWVAHAEANAVFNASRTGISLVGGTIYATTFPCVTCSIAIVQAGIARVFSSGEYWESDPNGYELALEIFADCGVAFDVPQERKRDLGLRRVFEMKDPSESNFGVRLPKLEAAGDVRAQSESTERADPTTVMPVHLDLLPAPPANGNDPQAAPKADAPSDQTVRPTAAPARARRRSSSNGARKAGKLPQSRKGTGASQRSDPTGRSRKRKR